METDQDYSKSGPAEKTITLYLNIFTQNMRATHGNNIPRGHIKITQNLESQKMRLQLASRFVPGTCGLHMRMISYGGNQDYAKSGFAKNKITLGLDICPQIMGITYGHDILWGQIKITQHLGLQKMRLHKATIFVPIT